MRFALTMLPAVPIFLAAPVIPPAPAATRQRRPPPRRQRRRRRQPRRGASSAADRRFRSRSRRRRCPTGCKVYVVGFDSPGLVAYYSVVRTGSRNEVEPGKSGFAHFFEHLMFRGSENYPPRSTTPSSRRWAPTRTRSPPTI